MARRISLFVLCAVACHSQSTPANDLAPNDAAAVDLADLSVPRDLTPLHLAFKPSGGDLTVGARPGGLATGDLNGDGAPDLVVTNMDENNLTVLLGDGHGGFAKPTKQTIPGDGPGSLVLADLNQDGKLDVAVANYKSAELVVMFGRGDGGFDVASKLAVGANPLGVDVGDFDGDGRKDIAVGSFGGGGIAVIYGNADGSPGHSDRLTAPTGVQSVVVADLNQDGKLDIAALSNKEKSHKLTDIGLAVMRPTQSTRTRWENVG